MNETESVCFYRISKKKFFESCQIQNQKLAIISAKRAYGFNGIDIRAASKKEKRWKNYKK